MGTRDSSEDPQGNTFRFSSRGEVIRFDSLVKSYLEDRELVVLPYHSLVLAYDKLEPRQFYSYFDLVISMIHLENDSWTAAQIWNEKFSKKTAAKGSFLDSADSFYGKLDMHRYFVSFVLRYRAIWDKIMGFIILTFSSEDYDKFAKAKSRKKSFKNIMDKHSKKWRYLPAIAKIVDEQITQFDEEFRTPEAHLTGCLRKSVFLKQPWREDPTFELYSYYKIAKDVVIKIDELIREIKV